jgi:hypothetical protein
VTDWLTNQPIPWCTFFHGKFRDTQLVKNESGWINNNTSTSNVYDPLCNSSVIQPSISPALHMKYNTQSWSKNSRLLWTLKVHYFAATNVSHFNHEETRPVRCTVVKYTCCPNAFFATEHKSQTLTFAYWQRNSTANYTTYITFHELIFFFTF